jgi:anaerobic selenocysteine-containing dehydrogenase
VTVDGERVVSVKGDPQHPASHGYTCAKGRSLGHWHHHPTRIRHPRVRRGSNWDDVSWTEANADIRKVIATSIRDHGVDSVGVYIGTAASLDGAGKWAAEQFASSLGTRSRYSAISIDNPCKPLVSLLMSGNPGLVPVVDDRRCTMTVFVGSNPVVSHGHLNGFPDPVVRLREMATSPKELWVIDSRATESSRLATSSLRPRPGTDFAILAFLIRELLIAGGCDRHYLADHVVEDDLRLLGDLLEYWTVERASEITGCPVTELDDLLSSIRRHGRVSFQTGTGTTMSATANLTEWLVWVLHIVTGSYDAPGGMWFHPGFLRRMDEDVVAKFEAPTPKSGPPSRPELPTWGAEYPCAAMADEIEAGNLRVLVVFGGNPVTAFPETERTLRALEKLDALIVLDVVDSETTEVATHVLPTKGQLERADLPLYYDQFTLDHSTQYSPAFVPPIGESRSMWRVAAHLAADIGASFLPASLTTDSSDDEVLDYLARRSGLGIEELRAVKYVSREPTFGWVLETVLPNGRWRLVPKEFAAQFARWRELVPPDGLLATSRRQVRQLNSQKPTSLAEVPASPVALVHPTTAVRHGIHDGDLVEVASSSGTLNIAVEVNSDVHPDVVSLAHGWRHANVCNLTTGANVDELTGMVVQTAIPIRIRSLSDGREPS